MSKTPLIENDVYNSVYFDPSFDRKTGYRTSQMICQPVFDENSKTPIAVLQIINRKSEEPFIEKDLLLLESLCSHISLSIQHCNSVDVSKHELRESMGSLQALRDQIQHMS